MLRFLKDPWPQCCQEVLCPSPGMQYLALLQTVSVLSHFDPTSSCSPGRWSWKKWIASYTCLVWGFQGSESILRSGQCGLSLQSANIRVCIELEAFSRKGAWGLLCRNLPFDQQVWLTDSSADTDASSQGRLTRSRVTASFRDIPESSGKFGNIVKPLGHNSRTQLWLKQKTSQWGKQWVDRLS